MSVLTVVECDLCGLGARGEAGTDPSVLMAEDGLVPGHEKGLELDHVHPVCADEYRRTGASGALLAGLGGLATP